MSLIAEYTIETPILQEVLESVPAMVLKTETMNVMPDRSLRSLVWARGDDFATFERSLAADPEIAEQRHITGVEDRRLYSILFTAEAAADFTYPALVETDSVMLDSTGTSDGLQIRARFPSYEALSTYREACRERSVPFLLRSLYSADAIAGDGGRYEPYDLTRSQREALVTAFEMGYFDVPRRTTLSAIGEELGISSQAVSTRLRRGHENLVRNALGQPSHKGLTE